jgi:hypothetical protein
MRGRLLTNGRTREDLLKSSGKIRAKIQGDDDTHYATRERDTHTHTLCRSPLNKQEEAAENAIRQ